MFHILVVDDDKNTRKLLKAILQSDGYTVYTAENGEAAFTVMENEHIDLVVLDIMMPVMDGYEFTKTLRDTNCDLPILMVTAKQLPDDRYKGFLVGTDDYITKPIDKREMLLRIKALLRRSKIASEHKMEIGEVVLNYDEYTVTKGNDVQRLPEKEFLLLYKLLSYSGKTFTRSELMDEIWGYDSEASWETITVHISRLRKRFDGFKEFSIESVHGLGYKAVKKL